MDPSEWSFVASAHALPTAPRSAAGFAFAVALVTHEIAAELDVGYTRSEAFFEPKSKSFGMSAIGTVDERNPVADDVGFGAVLEDALATGAVVFATGFDPPHAIIGKRIKVQTARAERIGVDNRSRLLDAA